MSNKDDKLSILYLKLLKIEGENREYKEHLTRLNNELQAHIDERLLLKKRLYELEDNYNNLKKSVNVVSIKEFKEIKTAIPLIKLTLVSTNKNLDNVKNSLNKYNRYVTRQY